jgi:alpha-tubulin suppressor-like RCC1 family protein
LKDIKCAQVPHRVDFGGDRKVNKIYAGYAHSMAITKTYEIFVWGDGKMGQLGRSLRKAEEPLSVDDLSGRDVVKGACGHDNCAAITSDGKLYLWGGNDNNKLGIKSNNKFETAPKQVESMNGIKRVSCGFGHTAAINTNGELYTWGHGYFGQLGHDDFMTKNEPKKVTTGDIKFEKVKCGSYHTLALDKKNMVYCWGRGGVNLNQEPNNHKKIPDIVSYVKI